MSSFGFTQSKSASESHALVVAPRVYPLTSLLAEMSSRGGTCQVLHDVHEAYTLSSKTFFNIILVYAREGVAETLLLLQLLKAHALGNPCIVLLAHPDQAYSYALAASPADTMLSSLMLPSRILDAAGMPSINRYATTVLNPAPLIEDVIKTKLLVLPLPFHEDCLPSGVGFANNTDHRPDAIVITHLDGLKQLHAHLSPALVAVLPIIDMSEENLNTSNNRFDAFAKNNMMSLQKALEQIQPILDQVSKLSKDYFETTSASWMLVAHLAVRNKGLVPIKDAHNQSFYRFFEDDILPNVSALADYLEDEGFISKKLHERLHCCPECQSARVQVREECSSCGSIDIDNVTMLHHFACGYHAPQRDFEKAHTATKHVRSETYRNSFARLPELHCPKCDQNVSGYGTDYDISGRLIECNDCGHQTGEPQVGFVCMDCNSNTPVERMVLKKIYEYKLTNKGMEMAYNHSSLALKEDKWSETTLKNNDSASADIKSLHQRVSQFANERKTSSEDYAVIMIRLDVSGQVRRDIGEIVWRDSVGLFGRLLRDAFSSQTDIVQRHDVFLVMIDNNTRAQIEELLPALREKIEKPLKIDLHVEYVLLGSPANDK